MQAAVLDIFKDEVQESGGSSLADSGPFSESFLFYAQEMVDHALSQLEIKDDMIKHDLREMVTEGENKIVEQFQGQFQEFVKETRSYLDKFLSEMVLLFTGKR